MSRRCRCPAYLPVAAGFLEGCDMGSRFTEFLRRLMAPKKKETSHQESKSGVEYEGYTIRPASRREGAQWLTAGVITKRFAEGVKEHRFIRAETHGTKDDADAFSVAKAKQIIDELGDRLFQKG
ncbi:MAG: HlyU family transcriptional regulator [Kiloniellaceae bacterium]